MADDSSELYVVKTHDINLFKDTRHADKKLIWKKWLINTTDSYIYI